MMRGTGNNEVIKRLGLRGGNRFVIVRVKERGANWAVGDCGTIDNSEYSCTMDKHIEGRHCTLINYEIKVIDAVDAEFACQIATIIEDLRRLNENK